MMRSLYSGVAGLKTHQTKMDVIGNNIANVNTTSFKSQSITFSDLMYQTTQTASGATETKGGVNARQIGLGAKSGAINTAIEGQGATQTTNNPFDIMITGKSFFVVNNGNSNLYTRDGSFYVDGAGNLAMQSNGYFVMGWAAQEDPETGEISVNKNGGLTNLQIMSADNSTYSPASTTAALVSGNIDDHDTNVISDDGKTITLEFYDNKGYLYTGKFTLKDTGEDHLFSLELTSIIDSMGNALPSKLMEGISFGNTTSLDSNTSDSYDVKVNGDKADIILLPGAVKYKNIPKTGTLSDLMSNGKGTLAGILENVYGITDQDVINGISTVDATTGSKTTAAPYGKTAKYEFTESGLEITYTVTPSQYTNMSRQNGYGYTSTNTNMYYVNSSNYKAYRAPSVNGGKAADLKEATLKDIFGITDTTKLDEYMKASNGYVYSYDNNTATLSIHMQSKLSKSAERINTSFTSLNSEADNFEGLKDYIDNNKSLYPGTIKDLQYTFDGTNLNIYEVYDNTKQVPTTIGFPTNITSNATIAGLTSSTSIQNIDDTAKAAIESALGISLDTYTPTLTRYKYQEMQSSPLGGGPAVTNYMLELYTADGTSPVISTGSGVGFITVDPAKYEAAQANLKNLTGTQNVADHLQDLMDALGKTEDVIKAYGQTFEVVQLSGTYAVKFLNTVPDGTTSTQPAANSPFKIKGTDYTANLNGYTETNEYKTVYSLSDGSAYVLPAMDKYTLEDIPEELLEQVYGIDATEKEKIVKLAEGKTARDYDVTFSSGGSLSISYTDTAIPTINADYELGADNSTDPVTYFFKTAKEITEYKDVPTTGNIKDLVSTADGALRGILTKAYDVSDENADAYGSDGTYKINDDGSITLTTGTHTIQLMFDPANGSLVSANGDPKDRTAKNTGLVNMTFINNDTENYPGLEAFGFQPTKADEEERRGQVTFDFSTVTNYNTSGSSTIKAVKGDKQSLNTGRAVGEMNGISISTDGQIYATYSNGQTKLLGQIATAEFANASGLSKEGDNLYKSTLNSGEATVQDITTDGGYMSTGVLEMSNVDLSSQFTEMITTQRGFQANSRIITVSDTLLEELTNLKR